MRLVDLDKFIEAYNDLARDAHDDALSEDWTASAEARSEVTVTALAVVTAESVTPRYLAQRMTQACTGSALRPGEGVGVSSDDVWQVGE